MLNTISPGQAGSMFPTGRIVRAEFRMPEILDKEFFALNALVKEPAYNASAIITNRRADPLFPGNIHG